MNFSDYTNLILGVCVHQTIANYHDFISSEPTALYLQSLGVINFASYAHIMNTKYNTTLGESDIIMQRDTLESNPNLVFVKRCNIKLRRIKGYVNVPKL